MADIKVDPKALRNARDTLSGLNRSTADIFEEARDILYGFDSCFLFKDYINIKSRIDEAHKDVLFRITMLEAQIEKLNTMADEYEKAERENKDEIFAIN